MGSRKNIILRWIKCSAIFWYALVYGMYITWSEPFELWKVLAVVRRIKIICVLTCALLHSKCNLKAAQMNVQHSLIRELMVYKFELSHKNVETIKNICCAKGEAEVDLSTVTRWFMKFYSGCKNLDDQARLSRPKTVDSEANSKSIRRTRYIPVKYG